MQNNPKTHCSIPIDFVDFYTSGMLNIVVEAENQRTVAITREFINLLEKTFYRSGKNSLKMLNDKVMSYMMIFPVLDSHPFYGEFYDQIQIFVASGTSSFLKIVKNPLYDEAVPPLVLSLDDLSIGFLVCLIPITFSVVTFMCEIATLAFKLFVSQLRDTLTASYVVGVFLKNFRTMQYK